MVAGGEYYDLIARHLLREQRQLPNHCESQGTTHVMTHHGTPVKRMGLDLVDTPGSDSRVGFAGLLRRCSRWDFSVTQNAFTTVAWERAFPTRYETLEVGYPRNDVLARATDEDVRRIRASSAYTRTRSRAVRSHASRVPPPTIQAGPCLFRGRSRPRVVVMSRCTTCTAMTRRARIARRGRIRDGAAHLRSGALLRRTCSSRTTPPRYISTTRCGPPDRDHAPDCEDYRSRRGPISNPSPGSGCGDPIDQELVDVFRSGTLWDDDSRARGPRSAPVLLARTDAAAVIRRSGCDREVPHRPRQRRAMSAVDRRLVLVFAWAQRQQLVPGTVASSASTSPSEIKPPRPTGGFGDPLGVIFTAPDAQAACHVCERAPRRGAHRRVEASALQAELRYCLAEGRNADWCRDGPSIVGFRRCVRVRGGARLPTRTHDASHPAEIWPARGVVLRLSDGR